MTVLRLAQTVLLLREATHKDRDLINGYRDIYVNNTKIYLAEKLNTKID